MWVQIVQMWDTVKEPKQKKKNRKERKKKKRLYLVGVEKNASFYIHTVNFIRVIPIEYDPFILTAFHSWEASLNPMWADALFFGSSDIWRVFERGGGGYECYSVGVFFCFICIFFTFFRQFMVPAWRQTLTDAKLSEPHQFDVVWNLWALDAGRLRTQRSSSHCLDSFNGTKMQLKAPLLTSLKVTFLLVWGSSTIFCKLAATIKNKGQSC